MSSLTPLISARAALEELAGTLTTAPAIGLDTEFLRERTYRAELCLLQLTTPHGPVCVDPLALTDLAPLAAVLGHGAPKVLHAGRQDLEVLMPFVGAITPLFDTQIAAALVGHPAQIGYGELVRRTLGHELPKAHTRTDWSRRPLSEEQIAYALDDVRYLLPLRDRLCEALDKLGRLEWLAEELREMEDPAGLEVDPERAWQRFKGMQSLDSGRLNLLRALAAWRERRAVARNRPRGWILDDTVLREIVYRVPRDVAQLAAIDGMPEGVVRHSGEELLALVAAAAIGDPPPPLPRRERPDPVLVARVKRLAAAAQTIAADLQLAAEVLVTRRVLEEIAAGRKACDTLHGWRATLLAARLDAVD